MSARIRRRFLLALTIPIVLLGSGSARASSYVLMRDEALLDQAPVVALVHVDSLTGAVDGTAATDYGITVEQTLKGPVRKQQSMVIRVVGGTDRNGITLHVEGAPRFDIGERALLFLVPYPDGTFRISQFHQGVFHIRTVDGQELALRSLDGQPLTLPGVAPPDESKPRVLQSFLTWIRSRVAGSTASPDDPVPPPGPGTPLPAHEPPSFLLFGSRWFEFDTSGSVTWMAHSSGQTGWTGGGLTEFQQGLAAWTNDSETPVQLNYGGTNSATGGYATSDGVNTVLWNDPNGEIAGSFNCTSGGTLAIGGWRSSGTGSYRGLSWSKIVEGDVVVQDNSACFMSGNGGANGAEVLLHEVGHAIGLRHSCGDGGSGPCVAASPRDDAIMRASVHGDGRGARLGAEDKLAIYYLYQSPGARFLNAYRLYHDGTKEHLFTTDANEYNTLYGSWVQEGIGFRLWRTNCFYVVWTPVPFYRLYHPGAKQHLLTTDLNEYNSLPGLQGWQQEGIIAYILDKSIEGTTTPLYRLSYPFVAGLHLWTTDLNEYNTLPNFGWIKEGIVGHVRGGIDQTEPPPC